MKLREAIDKIEAMGDEDVDIKPIIHKVVDILEEVEK